jgi:hypothetical protein
MKKVWLMLLSAVLMQCGGSTAEIGPGVTAADSQEQSITNGAPSGDSSVVGVVIVHTDSQNGRVATCSGVMLTPRLVLTAAHCLNRSAGGGAVNAVYVTTAPSIQSGPYKLASAWASHPGYVSAQVGYRGAHDVAMVVLSEGLNVPLRQVYRRALSFADFNRSVRVVGYGKTSAAANDGGPRREGRGSIGQVNGGYVNLTGFSTQCFGDSGGPSLINEGGVEKVLGVSSHVSVPGACFDNWNALASDNLAFIDSYVNAYR